MAIRSLSDEHIDIYFGEYLRNLDVESKKRVIAKFIDSIVSPPPAPTPDPEYRMTIDDVIKKYGPWEDTDFEGKPIGDLREARVGYRLPDPV